MTTTIKYGDRIIGSAESGPEVRIDLEAIIPGLINDVDTVKIYDQTDKKSPYSTILATKDVAGYMEPMPRGRVVLREGNWTGVLNIGAAQLLCSAEISGQE